MNNDVLIKTFVLKIRPDLFTVNKSHIQVLKVITVYYTFMSLVGVLIRCLYIIYKFILVYYIKYRLGKPTSFILHCREYMQTSRRPTTNRIPYFHVIKHMRFYLHRKKTCA